MATTPAVPVSRLEAGATIKVPDGKGGDKEVTLASRVEVYEMTEALEALVASGSLIKDENVIVKIEEAYAVYTQLLAVDMAGMQALVPEGRVDLVLDEKGQPKRSTKDEPVASVAQKFNYGNDLDAKREVRNQYEKSVAGPEKDIKAAIKFLVKLGHSPEEAEALATAKLGTE